MSEYDPPFEPTSNPASAGASEQFESINVCRVVALGTAFGPERALDGLERELRAMGLPEALARNNNWTWDDAVGRNGRAAFGEGRPREEVFSALSQEEWQASAVTFLVQVLSSSLERESAAAAAAIWVASGRRGGFLRRGGPRRRWYRLWDFLGFSLDLPGALDPWGTWYRAGARRRQTRDRRTVRPLGQTPSQEVPSTTGPR